MNKLTVQSLFLFSAIFLASSFSIAAANALLERGEYLVRGIAGCGNCHTPMGPQGPINDQELAGRLVEKNEAFTAIAPNITPASRIAGWTDEELGRAIREGIRPDGSVIGPPMPFAMYRGLSDTDVKAMITFLRSIPAIESDLELSQYNIPLLPAYGPPVVSIPELAQTVSVEYGEYLASAVAHCMECHTPMGQKGPLLDTDLGRGGFEFEGPWGTSIAHNITTHQDGLANYTDTEIESMIVKGTRPNGTQMLPPMPYGYLAGMTDDDLKSIILYLRTLPPLADK
jgi:mono/diheme cytochrome c family protein